MFENCGDCGLAEMKGYASLAEQRFDLRNVQEIRSGHRFNVIKDAA
jgi:hypothetical protein